MAIITEAELASYLDVEITANLALKVELANGIVEELPYATPLPTPRPTRVKAITLEVAGRAVRNPDGLQSEQIDDYVGRRNAATSEAGVYLTAAERAELLSYGLAKPRGSFYTVGLQSPLDADVV